MDIICTWCCLQFQFTDGLPWTRSGKIMRRILRKIAANESDELGDVSTLADPMVVEGIVKRHKQLMDNKKYQWNVFEHGGGLIKIAERHTAGFMLMREFWGGCFSSDMPVLVIPFTSFLSNQPPPIPSSPPPFFFCSQHIYVAVAWPVCILNKK